MICMTQVMDCYGTFESPEAKSEAMKLSDGVVLGRRSARRGLHDATQAQKQHHRQTLTTMQVLD